MNNKLTITVTILIIVLFLLPSVSAIIVDNKHTKINHEFLDKIGVKSIFMYNYTGSYDLISYENVTFFEVYCHIPVIAEGQSPIIINKVWTEPVNKLVEYWIDTNYSGCNTLLVVNISNMSNGETLKLFWSVSVIVKGHNYLFLPKLLLKTPDRLIPTGIKKWLQPSDFIQLDNPEIIAKAKELGGFGFNVFRIAKRIADYAGNEIEYKGGDRQDALTTLQNGYAVCTGKANLAAALLRANGIPARILMVYPTHYIVEYYTRFFGWIRLESTKGKMPYPTQRQIVAFTAHPEDETSNNIVNGQSPYGGVIAYWGTSNSYVSFVINYSYWSSQKKLQIRNNFKINKAINLASYAWNFYTIFLNENLSDEQEKNFLNATKYQKSAVRCFELKDIGGFIENLEKALDEYKIINFKVRGIAVGSHVVGDISSTVTDIMTFINDCNINMLIVDFGWITYTWNNTKFNSVSKLINSANEENIPVWLMYRARTLEGEYEHLQHQVNKNGEVDGRDICFTNHECRNWSISWAHKLLEKYPTVNGIILYNPRFLSDGCYCHKCLEKFKNDTGINENPLEFDIDTIQYETWMNWRLKELTDFITEWKNNIKMIYPDLQFGLVVNSGNSAYSTGQNISELGEIVDVICPFAALDSVTDANYAGDICNEVKEITNATVVADIKIYGPYNNTDLDIINAIKSSLDSNGDGFFIWCYDCLNPSKYDLNKIIDAYNGIYN